MQKNLLNLLARDIREPLKKLGHASTTLEVLEERFDRHSGALKQPYAADLAGHPLNRRTFFPVKHG